MTCALTPLILCGGSGSRLWPVSRKEHPKQFANLGLQDTLYRLTLARMRYVTPAPAVVVCGATHRYYAQSQAAGFNLGKVLVEPAARNTAAAVIAACLTLAPETLVLMSPSDHFMPEGPALADVMAKAAELAAAGHLVQLGIVPRSPATGYGYIQPGAAIGEGYAVARMKEKPSLDEAQQLVLDGYFWNSGILIFKVATLLGEALKYCPDILRATEEAMRSSNCLTHVVQPSADAYAAIPELSIDYAILEKTRNAVVLPYAGDWSDLGTWSSIHEHPEKDEAQNLLTGDAFVAGCENSLVMANHRLVCVAGLSNVVVVETPDAVLVADRRNAESVKQVVSALEKRGHATVQNAHRVNRPWGWYESLTRDACHQSKRLHLNDGAAISLQYHLRRAEHWVVINGVATVQLNDDTLVLQPGQSVFIPQGAVHRLSATQGDVELIEVQTGDYFGEDDIIRLSDNYERT